jgi:thiol-disulfide isomerase/thioredoxin
LLIGPKHPPMTRSRRSYLAAISAASVGLTGCLSSGGGSGGGQSGDGSGSSDWLSTSLTDVLTDETFTLDGFDSPVLMQNFAVWCSTCAAQEANLDSLRQAVDEVVLVNINVDQNEDATKVRQHAEQNGYDWRWAVPPGSFTRTLVETFDRSIVVPPNAPIVMICPDGSYRRLTDGVKSVEKLKTELDTGC